MTSTEWLKESKKIGVNVRSLERSSALNELESDFREITRARDDAFLGTKKKVQYFKSSLQDIKDRLAEVTKFRSHSGALQKSLETFESKLTTYKSTMRADFDSLANEETALDKDLDAFAGRVDSWLKNEKNVLSAADTSSDNIPSEQKSRTSDRYDRHVQLQAKIGAIDRKVRAACCISHTHSRLSTFLFTTTVAVQAHTNFLPFSFPSFIISTVLNK